MKYSKIFWGVILIAIGVLFALRNFDIFSFSWHSIFRLWPLILVFWGIAILPVKSVIKLILTVIAIFIAVIILVRHPGPCFQWFDWRCGDKYILRQDDNQWEEQHLTETYDSSVFTARLNLEAAAGKFYIKNTSSELFEFNSEGDTGPFKITTSQVNNTKIINVKHERYYIRRGKVSSKAWLALNPEPVWKLNIDVGAASLEMDLSPFKIEKVEIDGGASSIELKLGDKIRRTKVSIDAGASAIKIKIPYECACEVNTSTILSARELDGFNKIKKGFYQTPNFSDTANQIFIEVDAAVSSLKVIRY